MQRDLGDLVNDIKNEASVNPYGYNAAFCGVSLEPGLTFEIKPQNSRHKHIKKRRRGMSYDERKAAFDAGVNVSVQDKSPLWDVPGGLRLESESNW